MVSCCSCRLSADMLAVHHNSIAVTPAPQSGQVRARICMVFGFRGQCFAYFSLGARVCTKTDRLIHAMRRPGNLRSVNGGKKNSCLIFNVPYGIVGPATACNVAVMCTTDGSFAEMTKQQAAVARRSTVQWHASGLRSASHVRCLHAKDCLRRLSATRSRCTAALALITGSTSLCRDANYPIRQCR